jgi:hypothetical protein
MRAQGAGVQGIGFLEDCMQRGGRSGHPLIRFHRRNSRGRHNRAGNGGGFRHILTIWQRGRSLAVLRAMFEPLYAVIFSSFLIFIKSKIQSGYGKEKEQKKRSG